MFSKKEISFWVIALILSVMLAWSCRLQASEVEKKIEVSQKYPNFLLYNSTSSCMRGIVQIMIMLNPEISGRMMPPAVQQQIIGHCSCIMDKIRGTYTIQEYNKNQYDFLWLKNIWAKHGAECTKAGYLAGLGVQPGDNIENDNKTKESTEQDSDVESLPEDEKQFQG